MAACDTDTRSSQHFIYHIHSTGLYPFDDESWAIKTGPFCMTMMQSPWLKQTSYKDIATSYELLPQLDIVAIYTIATEILHCTSA